MDRIKFYLDTASGGMYVDYHLFRKVLKAIHDQFDELSSNSSSSSTTTTEFDTTELENRISTNETNIATLQTRADSEFITNASYDEENNQIIFTVANGTTVCTIDCTDFITSNVTSNILETAELVVNPDGQDEGTYIHLVFKTDEDTDDIYINVTSLIDIYTGSDSITVSDDNEISVNDDYVTDLISSNIRYETFEDSSRFGTGIGVIYVCDTEYIIYIYAANKSQAGLVKIGDGIAVTTDGIISIQISDSSEAYLTVDENGLAITGIDDIESRVTQAEANIDTLETQIATVNTDTITTVSSGDDYIAVADDGSYNYTITANLERITEDEITTLWEAI